MGLQLGQHGGALRPCAVLGTRLKHAGCHMGVRDLRKAVLAFFQHGCDECSTLVLGDIVLADGFPMADELLRQGVVLFLFSQPFGSALLALSPVVFVCTYHRGGLTQVMHTHLVSLTAGRLVSALGWGRGAPPLNFWGAAL